MDEPKKQGRGKPQHEPSEKDRRFVKFLAFKSAKQSEIAAVIGINETTLRERYKDELDIERDKMKATIIRAGYLMAVGGESEDWKQADPSMNKYMQDRFCGVEAPVSKLEISGSLETKGSAAREFIAGRIAGIAAALRPSEDTGGADGGAS